MPILKQNGIIRKWIAILILCGLTAGLFAGCGKKDSSTKVVLMTGFEKDEIFRIETISCTVPEFMVYLTNTQNQYEYAYGKEIWNADLDGVTLEENVKDTVLAKIAQVKTMNLLAENYQVFLDGAELEKVQKAAGEYYNSLTEQEIEKMGVSEETIRLLYEEYARADKVYEFLIKDINPEISDDEARTITVEHILIKTYAKDGTGKRISYTEEGKDEAYERAVNILSLAQDTENHNFEDLIQEYNEDSIATYSFGKGEMDPAFEAAAFELETGEISGIVESEYGYHIIKCLNTFNREETDANKLKIVQTRKKEVFGEKYDEFVNTLTRRLNEKLWQEVTFIRDEHVTTTTFFDVYMQYFD